MENGDIGLGHTRACWGLREAVLCEPKGVMRQWYPRYPFYLRSPSYPQPVRRVYCFVDLFTLGYQLRFHTEMCVYLFNVATGLVFVMENTLQPNSSGLLAVRISLLSLFSLRC